MAVVAKKVVEHICLLKAKEVLSDEEEKDMLDYLCTSQYRMGGIVAISLGRTSDQNKDYTHAVYMCFQRKEDLAIFYDNPLYSQVLKEHVFPHCHVIYGRWLLERSKGYRRLKAAKPKTHILHHLEGDTDFACVLLFRCP